MNNMKDHVDPLNLEIGQRIQKLREQKGRSRKDLAQRAKITEQSVFYIETGRRGLSSHTVCNISRALNVTSDFLLFGHTETNSQIDYASQTLANFTNEEQEATLKLIDKVADILRGCK